MDAEHRGQKKEKTREKSQRKSNIPNMVFQKLPCLCDEVTGRGGGPLLLVGLSFFTGLEER